MLFNSYPFIFVFLPLVLGLYYSMSQWFSKKAILSMLVVSSLFFYGWWNPRYLILILLSIIVNFLVAEWMTRLKSKRKLLFILGIVFNLGLLSYFKYANFFVAEILPLFNVSFSSWENILLPIAISFFTFQQIAYLVDVYQGKTLENDFLQYCLFVCFFPQLIAGPIVHHKNILPQFKKESAFRFNGNSFDYGVKIFIIGLFKKVVIADTVALYASPVFAASDNGIPVTFMEAWIGVLAYTFQIYFDFSGYTDMAIGLGKLFGIDLPLNFNSPYKSKNIIDFWRRWHITLSQFLKDYLYIPLGGNRKGRWHRYKNLMITMLLGGLWHGAGWNFIFWGFLHGFYLMVNHFWQYINAKGRDVQKFARLKAVSSWGITFLAVMVAWVFFRALTLTGATGLIKSMFLARGLSLPSSLSAKLTPIFSSFPMNLLQVKYEGLFANALFDWKNAILVILICFGLAIFFPNSQEILRENQPTRVGRLYRTSYAAFLFAIFGVVAIFSMNRVSEFLYFNF